MACLSNQIVCICAFLSNFHPALVPQPPKTSFEADVDKYFEELQNGSAHAVGASYSGLYEEGEVEHINVFSLAS